jgi:hypothetical protein
MLHHVVSRALYQNAELSISRQETAKGIALLSDGTIAYGIVLRIAAADGNQGPPGIPRGRQTIATDIEPVNDDMTFVSQSDNTGCCRRAMDACHLAGEGNIPDLGVRPAAGRGLDDLIVCAGPEIDRVAWPDFAVGFRNRLPGLLERTGVGVTAIGSHIIELPLWLCHRMRANRQNEEEERLDYDFYGSI